MILSHNRSMYMDFTKPIAVEDYNLVQAMPQLDNEIPIPGLSIDQVNGYKQRPTKKPMKNEHMIHFILPLDVAVVSLNCDGHDRLARAQWLRFQSISVYLGQIQ